MKSTLVEIKRDYLSGAVSVIVDLSTLVEIKRDYLSSVILIYSVISTLVEINRDYLSRKWLEEHDYLGIIYHEP